MNNLILCILPILFSAVKLKLGHKLSQFIHRLKIRILWVLVVAFTSRFFPIHKAILGFLSVALAGLLGFETFGCFSKFFFHCKWNDERLLLINMIYKSCLSKWKFCWYWQKSLEKHKLTENNPQCVFHMKTRVGVIYFVNGCSLHFQIFYQFTKELKNGDFWSFVKFILLDRGDSLSGTVCLKKSGGDRIYD